MGRNIYMIGGGKGGTGKSLVSMALADYLQQRGVDFVLVDTDTSNADVFKSCSASMETLLIDLDSANGWIALINLCDERRDRVVLINTAARNGAAVAANGKALNGALAELDRKLVTMWVINRQRDSLELLQEYMSVMSNSAVHVLRNGLFGDEKQFELYNGSKLRTAIESRGGKSLTFPALADRVADDLYTNRMNIATALKELPIGNRAELMRWRDEVKAVFEAIDDD